MPRYYKGKENFVIIPGSNIVNLINACRENHRRKFAIVLTLTWITGARINEVLMLTRKDFTIDRENDTVKIMLQTLKGGHQRELILSMSETPFMEKLILPYVEQLEPDREVPLFRRFKVRLCQKLLEEANHALSEYPPDWTTFHELRHSRATYIAKVLRGDTYELMNWFGWSDTRPVGTYLIRESSERFKDKIK